MSAQDNRRSRLPRSARLAVVAGVTGAALALPAAVVTAQAAPAYTSPVANPHLGTPYHAAGSAWASGYHTGVDFLVSTGTTVKAVTTGTVVASGWGGSYGNQVVIRHTDGKYSEYAHLSAITVRTGQSVGAGQQIGRSGATGNVTGPHLHFEVRTGPAYGSDINPVSYLAAHGVRV
ncbi:M23 family metallopeptidase [Saccharothrix sp. ST-888]|uniref:M23 family metallopeptidase n=1 Tax=Saccharothrix sp. ST-888 TaxID=1427391 RepID=UPI0009E325B0|nr:M23 family metallopeptidase [Saccharothrix sp. ST-888]